MLRVVAVLAICVSPAVANAQWINDTRGGAFDDRPMQMALTGIGNYAFGFRCTNSSDLEAIFITPEKAEDDMMDTMNAALPKLLIRIDQNPPKELPAALDVYNEKITAISSVPVELLKEVRDGKSRLAVAMSVLGQNFHETEFNLIGSTASAQKIADGCGLWPGN